MATPSVLTSYRLDRGEVVNLARNALDDEHLMGQVSRAGIRRLCEGVMEMDKELKRLYAQSSGPSEQEWLEDQLIEVMRLASRGLWEPEKDDAITDTLRLHGIRLLVEAYPERYEALLDRVNKRRDATKDGQ